MRTCERKEKAEREEAADALEHGIGMEPPLPSAVPAAAPEKPEKRASRLQLNQTVLPVVGKRLPFGSRARRADKKDARTLFAGLQIMALCKSPFEVWSVCCPDIIPALILSPLSAKGVCRNVLFLKRPRRRSSLLGIPSVRQSLPCLVHIVRGENRMHGRGREEALPSLRDPGGRAYPSVVSTLARGVRDMAQRHVKGNEGRKWGWVFG